MTPQGGPTNGADPVAVPGPLPRSPDRPLNVTDALSYLDAVKVQFQDKPDVYNHFLDIMKDFKSQVIDTPGVIERVSMLFHGNPYLIQGFNTFLPPGYRIELSTDPRNVDTITVTTPMGTMTQSTTGFGAPLRLHHDGMLGGPSMLPYIPQPPPFGLAPPPILPVGLGSGSRPVTPLPRSAHGQSPFTEVSAPYSPAQGGSTTAAASVLGNLGSTSRTVEKAAAGEFNHAIQYLNKIKTRFADDPETYKQFLEILQTYQKEQKHLHDSQVYAQVQMLFKDAPDLMAEFKDFLPEAMPPAAQQAGLASILPQNAGTTSAWTAVEGTPTTVEKAKPSSRRRKRGPEKEPAASAQKASSGRVIKKAKTNQKPEPQSPKFSPYQGPRSPAGAHAAQAGPSNSQPAQLSRTHSGRTADGGPSAPVPHAGPVVQDEFAFFERARKALENSGTYDEFLKLLHLFSTDVLDLKALVERAEIFLGDGDLMIQFKALVGWDDKHGNVEYGPPGSIRTGAPDNYAPRAPDDNQGPSYRRLPESEVRLACSGRDQLSRSVLNDQWVSHPTWASEESGFISHKKNSFEDTLHKSEEERHEYQVHIEALSRTIAVFEPLDARIEEMTPEERSQFRLGPDLGGTSRMIYQRIIKKVYGRDAGLEIIRALQESPSVAVPVVLARLKQKDEEWRRLQREWSRTWREVDAKNFYKALDHQGIMFKQNDKKGITAKHFVQDIESVRAEQAKLRDAEPVPRFNRSLGHQLEYEFKDLAVLHDCLKLIYSFLDHSPAQYGAPERRSIENFLRSFVPAFLMVPPHEFDAACGPPDPGQTDEGLDNGAAAAAEEADDATRTVLERDGKRVISGGEPNFGGVSPGDLRKRLLKTVQEGSSRKGKGRSSRSAAMTRSGTASPAGSPRSAARLRPLDNVQESEGTNGRTNTDDCWIQEAVSTKFARAGETVTTRRPFFANTTFYTLLRLLQLLYSRLLKCKQIGAQMAAQKHAPLLANPVAVQLGLDEPNGPSVILAQAIEALGENRTGEDTNVLYMYLLDACEKVFESDMDQATFEEHMRWFFGTKAYHVFTLDRLMTAIVKQVQTIMGDNKCQELWELLQHERSQHVVTVNDTIRYRREAERHVGSDDNLYRFDWVGEVGKTLRMQLVGSEEPSTAEDETSLARWREYVATYVMDQPTEWTAADSRKKHGVLFLKRWVAVILRREWRVLVLTWCACCRHIYRSVVEAADEKARAEGMEREKEMRVLVERGTYKLVYEAGSEETLWRRRGEEAERALRRRAGLQQEERRRRLARLLRPDSQGEQDVAARSASQ
ncbi:hypothetical protein CERSUDRAFT_42152 [Gelatoporia subvermispora B]|uniref:Histone deacetylase interacting domain-containing protein n=1 Tax=Ceriporiopsis subvermispora (strain B) TaxID=914234 RepID=M2RSG8_CERS8|nr:hypothetical protein CERSUDRAFT_42152 [Gelatoporia subvermispora B]